MTEKRYRTGKGIFNDGYFSETIIDEKTGKKYYDGITANYISSKKLVELLNQQEELEKENKQLKQALQEVYNDDYYLKQFIIAIINCYSKNRGVSPIRLEMIWDSLDMNKTSLKHLKSSFYE